MRLHGESAWTGRRRARPCLGRRAARRPTWRVRADPVATAQPVRAYLVDRPGRVLRRQHLRDRPDADGYLWLGGDSACLGSITSHRPVAPGRGQRLPEQERRRPARTRIAASIGALPASPRSAAGQLTLRKDVPRIVAALFEDRARTVWVGTLDTPHRRLCAVRTHAAVPAAMVASSAEPSRPSIRTARAPVGRCGVRTLAYQPRPLTRHATPSELSALTRTDDDSRSEACAAPGWATRRRQDRNPIRSDTRVHSSVCCRTTTSIRTAAPRPRSGSIDRNGAARADPRPSRPGGHVLASDSLSGDVVLRLFEDREGSISVATTEDSTASGATGHDRFRKARPVQ